jgi:precorrin-2 dehydrogenase/sirohydrochlorin ferrochelatase
MGYYPIFLEMDRRCVVIGGGAVAERKVEGLVAAGANVTVISPGMTDGLKELLKQARSAVAREYQAGDRADTTFSWR